MEELVYEEAMSFVATSDVAHLGVLDDGDPYVSPISYVLIDNKLYFRTGSGRRLDALKADPRVSVEISEYDIETGDWKSVIASGTAFLVTEDAEAQAVVGGLLHKYSSAIGSPLSRGASRPLPEPGVIVGIEMKQVTGRVSGSWFSLPTRPGRL